MRPHEEKSCNACRGVYRDTPPDLGCQCDGFVEKRAETIVLVVVQAAPPAARLRADAAYMAVLLEFFKAGVVRKNTAVISKLSTT